MTVQVKLQLGQRVEVTRSPLYKGRTGYLVPNSGAFDDPWDYNMILDPDPENPNRRIRDSREIGVSTTQIRAIDGWTLTEKHLALLIAAHTSGIAGAIPEQADTDAACDLLQMLEAIISRYESVMHTYRQTT